MEQLSEKELSAIQDLLSDEEVLVKKFKMLASHAQHQGHFNALYAHLK